MCNDMVPTFFVSILSVSGYHADTETNQSYLTMKKFILSICAVALLTLSGCDKYDDGPLSNRVDNLENRVKSLEEQCKQLNTNVTSIQTLVNAMENGDAITSVTPIKEGDKEVGYTLAFAKSPAISVYHGKDGNMPVIGAKQDSDGNYYWTVNGEWLLDDKGEKAPCNGSSDSVIPEFKIDKDNWLMSADGGKTWVNLGKGTADGTNAVFNDIDTSDPEKVIFTLSDGTKFTLPRQSELTIKFDEQTLTELKSVSLNSTYNISYVVEGSVVGLKLEVISSGNVKAKLNNRNSAKGTISITTGDAIDEYDKVILLATNGKVTVMSSISFGEEDFLQVTSGTTYNVPKAGGTVSINLETNTDYSLSIPEEHKSWVSIVESRAYRQETVTLSISENKDVARTATIQLVDKDGNAFYSIEINQENGKEEDITSITLDTFPDSKFRRYVLDKFDTNRDGGLSNEEAFEVTEIDVSGTLDNWGDIYSLEGIQYFPNLKELYCSYNKLTSLDVSKNTKLTVLYCSLNRLTSLDVSKNTALTELWCNSNELRTLDVSKNTALAKLDCNNTLLTSLDVSGCTALTTLGCHCNQLTSLDISGCTALTELRCDYNPLTSLDVSKNTALTELYCGGSRLTTLDVSVCTELTILNCDNNSFSTTGLLTSLDVSKNTKLEKLSCRDNQLTSLDVSKNTALTELHCDENKLTSLDVSKNTALTGLDCDDNQLTSLDVSKNTKLTTLYCDMSTLKTLYLKSGKSFYISKNNSTEIIYID